MGGGDCTPTLAMVAVQVGFTGLNVVSKLAMNSGMSPFVLIAYRQMVATMFTAPFAYFVERKTRMKITGRVLFQIFICSIFGATMNQLTYFMGLKYSTPTVACALNNMLPAITFVMAVPFRIETVGIRTLTGQAKVLGTIICVGGSMLMTFYKGSLINLFPSPIHWKYPEEMAAEAAADHHGGSNMLLGAFLVVASCFAWAVWFIVQAKMGKSFSSPYTSSALMCSMASIQCLVIGAAVEREKSAWALGWDIRLYAVLYIGLIGSGFSVSLMAWCIERRGPLFVSMFNPVLLVMVAVMGWAILDEKLYVGTAMGSALIVGGLYMVLWGKGKEEKRMMSKLVGGKAIEENDQCNTAGTVGLPVYFSPDHDAKDGQTN